MPSKRYTEEQLSRILSEHEAGTLKRFGACDWTWETLDSNTLSTHTAVRCCINQAAYNTPSVNAAEHLNFYAADWFDDHYVPNMSTEELLHGIDKPWKR